MSEFKNKVKREKLNIKIDKTCKSFLSKGLGLMFSTKPKTTLLVNKKEKPTQIHTFFMFYAIDVYWLDENKTIVDKKKMNPWRLSKVILAKYILETRINLVNANIGDRLEF